MKKRRCLCYFICMNTESCYKSEYYGGFKDYFCLLLHFNPLF
ncbi:Uncharacterized protein dnm_002790 [Desulfonema magnum]|uniref:Uncharacterized protein n=1 Tax=Desulfonema magnum TaxID=45655 RepID=A0A975GK98_9BACT|nr:Uncharacterized protein dnm_002790 [Desulfonema magnum]